MFPLDVTNKKVGNFHKSVVTTSKVHSLLWDTFLQLVWNHGSHFTQNLESDCLDDVPQCLRKQHMKKSEHAPLKPGGLFVHCVWNTEHSLTLLAKFMRAPNFNSCFIVFFFYSCTTRKTCQGWVWRGMRPGWTQRLPSTRQQQWGITEHAVSTYTASAACGTCCCWSTTNDHHEWIQSHDGTSRRWVPVVSFPLCMVYSFQFSKVIYFLCINSSGLFRTSFVWKIQWIYFVENVSSSILENFFNSAMIMKHLYDSWSCCQFCPLGVANVSKADHTRWWNLFLQSCVWSAFGTSATPSTQNWQHLQESYWCFITELMKFS